MLAVAALGIGYIRGFSSGVFHVHVLYGSKGGVRRMFDAVSPCPRQAEGRFCASQVLYFCQML